MLSAPSIKLFKKKKTDYLDLESIQGNLHTRTMDSDWMDFYFSSFVYYVIRVMKNASSLLKVQDFTNGLF